MRKILQFIKNNAIGFIVGLIIAGGVGVYAVTVASSDVTYDNTASGSTATTVKAAIDDLYNRVNEESGGGSIAEIARIHVRVTQTRVSSYQPQVQVDLFDESDTLVSTKTATNAYQRSVNEEDTAVTYTVSGNTIKVIASGYYGNPSYVNYIKIFLNDVEISTLYAQNAYIISNSPFPTVTDYYLGIMDNKIAIYEGGFSGSSSSNELKFLAVRTSTVKVTSYQPQVTIEIFNNRGTLLASTTSTNAYQRSVVEEDTATTYNVSGNTFKVTSSGYYGNPSYVNHTLMYLNDVLLATLYLPNLFYIGDPVYPRIVTHYIGVCSNRIILYNTDIIQ